MSSELSPPNTDDTSDQAQADTRDEIKMYLASCFLDDPGDGSAIKAALARIASAHGYSALARATGLTRAGLYRALSADGDPRLSTILKIMNAMQLTR